MTGDKVTLRKRLKEALYKDKSTRRVKVTMTTIQRKKKKKAKRKGVMQAMYEDETEINEPLIYRYDVLNNQHLHLKMLRKLSKLLVAITVRM